MHDFGKVFRAIGSGAKRATELGAKYVIRGAKAGVILAGKGTKRGLKYALSKAHEKRAKDLIRKSYAKEPTVRYPARLKLKQESPELYNLCSFSR